MKTTQIQEHARHAAACPACGAAWASDAVYCNVCGAARATATLVAPSSGESSRAQAHKLIEALNSRLAVDKEYSGNISAAILFGGFGLGLLLAVLFYLHVDPHWGWSMAVAGTSFAVAVGVGMAVDEVVGRRRLDITYAQVIAPQIASFLAEQAMSEQQFYVLAHETLPKDAPLRRFLFGATPDNPTTV